MHIPFEEINGKARIWIYQADRLLTRDETLDIEAAGQAFVSEWTAHRQTLKSSFKVFHALFLMLAVDETEHDASGCSIDKSVHFIKGIEQRFRLSLFDRLRVAYKEGEVISIKPIKEFVSFYNSHPDQNTIRIFDNTITTKEALDDQWIADVKNSWMAGRLKQPV